MIPTPNQKRFSQQSVESYLQYTTLDRGLHSEQAWAKLIDFLKSIDNKGSVCHDPESTYVQGAKEFQIILNILSNTEDILKGGRKKYIHSPRTGVLHDRGTDETTNMNETASLHLSIRNHPLGETYLLPITYK